MSNNSRIYPLYPPEMSMGRVITTPLTEKGLLESTLQRLQRAKKNNMMVKGALLAGRINPTVRRVDTIELDHNQYPEFYEFMAGTLTHINSLSYRYTLTHLETLTYCEYNEKDEGFYDLHMDQTTYEDSSEVIRKLAFSLALNDSTEYEGGELEFKLSTNVTITVKEDANFGCLTTFRPNLPHTVRPVTKGIRKVIVGWVLGPIWR